MTERDIEEKAEEGTLVRINAKISVRMRTPTDDQVMVVTKQAAIARRRSDRSFDAVGIFFRVFEAVLVDPDDIETLDQGLIDGGVTVEEMTKGFFSLVRGEEDSATSTPAKRTRRRS